MNSAKPRSVFSAICRSNGIILGRMRATVGSRFSQNASRASATHRVAVLPNSGNVVASVLPVWRKLRRTVELTQAPVLRTFSSPYRGRVWRLILQIFAGSQVLTAGKCCFSFLRSLVQDANQPTSGLFHRFEVSEVLSFVPTDHAHKKAWRWKHDAQRNTASGA